MDLLKAEMDEPVELSIQDFKDVEWQVIISMFQLPDDTTYIEIPPNTVYLYSNDEVEY